MKQRFWYLNYIFEYDGENIEERLRKEITKYGKIDQLFIEKISNVVNIEGKVIVSVDFSYTIKEIEIGEILTDIGEPLATPAKKTTKV